MRGNVSPFFTRRSSASDDGRVLVGSMPTRLYIVRTAAMMSVGSPAARMRAVVSRRLASSDSSSVTTRTGSAVNHAGRTMEATSGCVLSIPAPSRHGTGDDGAHPLGQRAHIVTREALGRNRVVHRDID